jgi:hypothetical protein
MTDTLVFGATFPIDSSWLEEETPTKTMRHGSDGVEAEDLMIVPTVKRLKRL